MTREYIVGQLFRGLKVNMRVLQSFLYLSLVFDFEVDCMQIKYLVILYDWQVTTAYMCITFAYMRIWIYVYMCIT